MSKIGDLIIKVIEDLELKNFDYETVATMHNMTPTEVFEIAKEYGDICDVDYQ